MFKWNLCRCCKSFCKEFKDYALQGNVFELTIGVIVGTAFSNIMKSLVEDMITPPLALLLAGVDFSNLTASMPNLIFTDEPPIVLRYGKFVQQVIYLLIMTFVLFFVIKALNKLSTVATQKKLDEENRRKAELSNEVKVLLEIRNILAWKSSIFEEVFV